MSNDPQALIAKIRQRIDDRIANRLKELREFHQLQLDDGSETERSFEKYAGKLALPCVVSSPASDADIEAFEQKVKLKIPDDVRLMYRTLGGWGGNFPGEMLVTFPSPKELVQDFADDAPAYSRLRGIGLHDMVNHCWGTREDLQVDSGFPQQTIDTLNRFPCFGWFGDGYCESHAYIIQTGDNRYSLYGWHQDYGFSMPTQDHEMGLFELILKVLETNECLSVSDDGEETSIFISDLLEAINGEREF
ncbi:MAG: SMI1/KNR4 family protein [Rubripirellula sp.]